MRTIILLTGLILFLISNLRSQPASWSPRGVGGGGALFSPSINPANNNEYFVACDLSAVFLYNGLRRTL
ncbi:MAG: hypothetical protein IPJ82_20740 [Lewinellaceae bacterium]|nr:hypothetical protein [Lewinellaceae bacterium]